MSKLKLACRTATTFSKDGAFDEDTFRRFLQRFVDAGIGIYLASAGTAESNAMTDEELRRMYRVGVEVCKGKVPVNANPPERPTVRETLKNIMIAIEEGVEMVNVYGPPGWHAYRPTNEEYIAFFDQLLPAVKHPIAFTPNPSLGYLPQPDVIIDLCLRYSHIVALNLSNQRDDHYFIACREKLIELKGKLGRTVEIHVPIKGSLTALLLGAAGLIGGDLNIIPKTGRLYLDLYESKKYEEAALVYADIRRFIEYIAPWDKAHARYTKMAMRVLKIPGGEGGLRGPYVMPPESELEKFADGLLRLRIPEISELARAAGLTVPA
jgi:dihydrodipicolinate synthase/N-acetylneuraminate lyase